MNFHTFHTFGLICSHERNAFICFMKILLIFYFDRCLPMFDAVHHLSLFMLHGSFFIQSNCSVICFSFGDALTASRAGPSGPIKTH